MMSKLRKAHTIALCCIVSVIATGVLLASCTLGPAEQWCASNATTSFNLKDLQLQSISMISPNEGWAASADGFLHYSNGKWNLLTDKNEPILSGIYMRSANLGVAVGWNGTIVRYKDGCWQSDRHVPFTVDIPNPQVNSVSVLSDTSAWAAGDEGILRYSAGSWSTSGWPKGIASGLRLTGIYMLSDQVGWAVGGGSNSDSDSVILQYKDGQWARQPSSNTFSLNAIYMLSPDNGWAVGNAAYKGVILHYQHGKWEFEANPDVWSLRGVYMISTTEGWAVGHKLYHGVILHYANGQWGQVNIPATDALNSIAMVSPTEGWAVGDKGAILHYQNGSWQQWQQ